MKKFLISGVAAVLLGLWLVTFSGKQFPTPGLAQVNAQDEVKMPEVVVLGKDAKLGQVTFSHAKHNGGTYSIDGTGPIACIECHHAAQPASELVKHPPLRTAWPTDRTTT